MSGAFGHISTQAQTELRPANPYGVNVFLHKEVEEWKIDKTLSMISEANIAWVKQEFPWQEIEFKKGYFHDDKWDKPSWEKFDRIVSIAEKYKLNVIARIDHAPEWARANNDNGPLANNRDLADFINAFLDHYKGRINYIQVWNEPNLAAEWVPGRAVNPAEYAHMLKDVYPLVKQQNPGAIILSAPMAMTLEGPEARGNMNEIDYWNGLYDAGVKGSFDVATANGYGLDQPPDAPPDPNLLNFRRVELLREVMVNNGDASRPIWLNEFAWNASPESLAPEEKNYWRHVMPEQQAKWTVQGIEYARKNWPWAGVVLIWYFRQVGDVPPEKAEYYFAMVNPDFTTQPVYDTVKAAAANYPGPVAQPPAQPTNPPPTPTAEQAAPTATTQAATPTTQAASPTPTSQTPTASPQTVTPTAAITTQATPGPTTTAIAGASTGTGNNTLLFVLGGLLVVAGLAGLGFYFMRSKTAS
ncbi:MAG: polysaccharide biosynthesis protein PslG [Chloroflexia bacterium]|nr:polysaccharide biosynthesis protein PslG [Chloroflexia bacterium]